MNELWTEKCFQTLEEKNKAKLSACVSEGYSVVLVLNHKKVLYEEIMD